jgi:hypothetical protein
MRALDTYAVCTALQCLCRRGRDAVRALTALLAPKPSFWTVAQALARHGCAASLARWGDTRRLPGSLCSRKRVAGNAAGCARQRPQNGAGSAPPLPPRPDCRFAARVAQLPGCFTTRCFGRRCGTYSRAARWCLLPRCALGHAHGQHANGRTCVTPSGGVWHALAAAALRPRRRGHVPRLRRQAACPTGGPRAVRSTTKAAKALTLEHVCAVLGP